MATFTRRLFWLGFAQFGAAIVALIAAMVAAQAAIRSADLASKTLMVVERPYVHTGNWVIQNGTMKDGTAPVANYTWSNSGKTPARLLSREFGVVLSRTGPQIPKMTVKPFRMLYAAPS